MLSLSLDNTKLATQNAMDKSSPPLTEAGSNSSKKEGITMDAKYTWPKPDKISDSFLSRAGVQVQAITRQA